MLGESQTEQRSAQRRMTLKGGRIAFNNGRSTFDCTVKNLSRQGAKLVVGATIGIPDSFDLVLPNTAKQPCKVIWRKDREIGVEFVGVN